MKIKTFAELVMQEKRLAMPNHVANYMDDCMSEEELISYCDTEESRALAYGLIAFNYVLNNPFNDEKECSYLYNYEILFAAFVAQKPKTMDEFYEIESMFFNHEHFNMDENGLITKKVINL